jgi:2-dehydro-3-deoxyphosphogluconate aldolase / (4S)-4-hydroxy-2-oxoglutarate aldolase
VDEETRHPGLLQPAHRDDPADVAGGVKMLKTLSGPYGHTGVKFIPLGGVSATTLKDFLGAPCVTAVGGSWIAERSLIKAGDWAGITSLAKKALAIATGNEEEGPLE